jgi:hypothetical protein
MISAFAVKCALLLWAFLVLCSFALTKERSRFGLLSLFALTTLIALFVGFFSNALRLLE